MSVNDNNPNVAENSSSNLSFEEKKPEPRSYKTKSAVYAAGLAIIFIAAYHLLLSPPAEFPVGSQVKIVKGSSLRSVSSLLEKERIVRSRTAFEFFVILLGREKGVVSADYSFETRLPVFEVARRIGRGIHGTAPVSVTIPEGFDLKQIGETFALELASFNKDIFMEKAKGLEGYLFPDTYYFLTNAGEDEVISSMNSNFKEKVKPLLPEIHTSKRTENEIITMASIIEREAKGDNDRDMISGVLWKRISINMPLQADAAPETYKERGLPKSPIANPGLGSIKAAIHPKDSPYLYYLHDPKGNIHFAKDYAEHQRNINKYLKNTSF